MSAGRRVGLPVALALVCAQAAGPAQTLDVTNPPPLVQGAGGFTARRLRGAPSIDGREWTAVDVLTGPAPSTLTAPNRRFTLRLEEPDPGVDTGDFQRYELFFSRGGAGRVRIDRGFTGWVYVTPDSRYVITEPLYVLDVRAWTQHALFEALQIPNYTEILAISRNRKRLLVSRTDCRMDCTDAAIEYYELRLP